MNSDFKFRLGFSGGGFRSTLFCLGVYRRIVELGLQNNIISVSSVSGGSITAGQILCALIDGEFSSIEDFDKRVTDPIIALCKSRLRNRIMKKIISPLPFRRRFSQQFPIFLDNFLFKNISLHNLPDVPEWSINTTCLNSGKRVRFKKKDFGGNIIGHSTGFKDAKISYAVACSAAYPMMFAPYRLSTKNKLFFYKYDWQKSKWGPAPVVPDPLYLSDGGVYDNLGSEGLFHTKDPFIICDASGFLETWDFRKKPSWFSRNWRPLDTGLDQIVLLRRRLLYQRSEKIKGYQLILRDSINNVIKNPEIYGSLSNKFFDLPHYKLMSEEHQNLLGLMRTDFDGFHEIEIQSLMWSGAARIDIALKRYLRDLIKEESINDLPKLPEYPHDKITQVLKRGTQRRILTRTHRDLKN